MVRWRLEGSKREALMVNSCISELKSSFTKYNKVVIWGLLKLRHTHRYIHQTFHKTLAKVGLKVVWVEDVVRSRSLIEKNDLVISANMASTKLPVLKDVYYCLHNCDNEIHERIAPTHNVRLQVYKKVSFQKMEKWDEVTFFDGESRTLYQPWGTDLLEDEFYEPVRSKNLRVSFWIGSVWNNELDQGNINEIAELRRVLKKQGIRFIVLRHIPDRGNVFLTRRSLIAPAIGGRWQVEHNYLPCRMFKNISYGQIGVSNIKKFVDLFGQENSIQGDSIGELIENSLSLSPARKVEMIRAQQEIVKKQTYIQKFHNILKAFERVSP